MNFFIVYWCCRYTFVAVSTFLYFPTYFYASFLLDFVFYMNVVIVFYSIRAPSSAMSLFTFACNDAQLSAIFSKLQLN